jgi:phosphonoacetaldehyde hydrolase
MERNIKGIIFNVSGVLIDKYGCLMFNTVKNLYKRHKIKIDEIDICKNIGLPLEGIIINTINIDSIGKQWYLNTGGNPNYMDIMSMKDEGEKIQLELLKQNSINILPNISDTFKEIKERKILTAITSELSECSLNNITKQLSNSNIRFNSVISRSNQDPFSIYTTMKRLDLYPARDVIKIDSTINGIKEGYNAGCYTIGVSNYSPLKNYMNEKDVKKKLLLAGANKVIEDISELPTEIDLIEEMIIYTI